MDAVAEGTWMCPSCIKASVSQHCSGVVVKAKRGRAQATVVLDKVLRGWSTAGFERLEHSK